MRRFCRAFVLMSAAFVATLLGGCRYAPDGQNVGNHYRQYQYESRYSNHHHHRKSPAPVWVPSNAPGVTHEASSRLRPVDRPAGRGMRNPHQIQDGTPARQHPDP